MTNTTAYEALISNLNLKLLLAYKSEEEYWKQRSRQLWLSLGDRKTGLFHASTKERRARNRLSVIEDPAGLPVVENEQITEVISEYFRLIFSSSNPSRSEVVEEDITPCIDASTNERLNRNPIPKWNQRCLVWYSSWQGSGAWWFFCCILPRPLGHHWTFNLQWDPTIFQNMKTTPLNQWTHIRLITKIHSPKAVSDYRPISLCNVYYKTISKIMSLRLKPVLQDIVSENQSTFKHWRSFTDNVLITHEVLHYLNISTAEKRCGMAVKTDISKAFDRLEWFFIQTILEKMIYITFGSTGWCNA